MMLHTFVPADIIINGIDEDKPEYIKYNGVICQLGKCDGGRCIERLISTNPQDYLNSNLLGKKITKLPR